MFSNSSDFQVHGGTFCQVAGDVHLQVPPRLGEIAGISMLEEPSSAHENEIHHGIHIKTRNFNNLYTTEWKTSGLYTLHRHAALDALYNSVESFPQPRCHPETRTALLESLSRRLKDPKTDVVWLHGPAGAGKTAIMQTLCQQLQEAGQLGGSFFFKRTHPTRGSGRFLFATLAYQLAIVDPALKVRISKTAEQNPTLVGTSIASQLRNLLVDPCRAESSCSPHILVIDGLDECDGVVIQQEILRSIRSIFCEHTLPLKIILASRPEPDIREVFEAPSWRGLYSENIEQSFADVKTYLRREFARIHREHSTMSTVSTPWPSFTVMNELVNKSSGYFVYAATVIKFVDDKEFRPTDQLEIILDPSYDTEASPFEPLDKLYFQILSQVPTRSRSRLRDILSIVCAGQQLSLRHIEQLLDLQAGDVSLILRRLHSVLHVADEPGSITTRHASFPEFLMKENRSSTFHLVGPMPVWRDWQVSCSEYCHPRICPTRIILHGSLRRCGSTV
ncbi:hypothetical protein FB45DRAFT_273286 [Roridomyces roridus]|uniref:Nephrocystin 3-like N-terminal domain-containing protein n=1 Tax=Roridomyces roridus TaxID=1738132 RepID=A0AAD7B8E3_9AGAR|nr:hypothetical protein FB45DRAFT_273286 [Roridomyces roridus]